MIRYCLMLLLGTLLLAGCQPTDDDDTTGDDDDTTGDDDDTTGDDDDTTGDDDDDTGDDDDTTGDDDDTTGDDDDATGDDDDAEDADGDGWTVADGDCDDTDPMIHPGASEICNGIDDDCSGATPPWDTNTDADGDGWSACTGDCNDADPALNPWAAEVCDGVDNDCNGSIDEGCHTCAIAVPGDFADIQLAITSATDGDVICVDSDTYVGNLDYQGKALIVLGLAGPHLTILEGVGWESVITLDTAEGPTTTLQGFTVTGGAASQMGGGLYVDGAHPVLRRLIVADNESYATGGGIYIGGSASPQLSEVIVLNNHVEAFAPRGGGIYVDDSSPTFADVLVQGNTIGGGDYAYGGGVAMESSTSTWVDSKIVSNACEDFCEGGGLFLSGCDTTLDNVRVVDNETDSKGAGLHVGGGSLMGRNIHVVGNTSWGDGGGVYLLYGDVDLEGFSLSGNGAVYGSGGALFGIDSVVLMVNGAIHGNSSGLHEWASAAWALDGVAITGSTGVGIELTGGTAAMSHCDLWGNGTDVVGMANPVGADGNIGVDPSFLNVTGDDPLTWNMHLAATSPLIDAGNAILLDPDGSISDIGAYGGTHAGAWDLDDDGYLEWWLPGTYDPLTSPGLDCDDLNAARSPGSGC